MNTDDGLHRDGEPLTDDQFRGAATHMWLNGFSCIRPTDEFAADIGRQVIAMAMQSDIRTRPIDDYKGSRAAIFYVNVS